MQISWFRQPAGDDPGSLNLCYHAVDLAVIRGAALDPAVRHPGGELDYATLLERVAALAGAMRGLGVVPGAPVGVLLDDPLDELLAVLATARLGAVVLALDPDDPAALLAAHRPALVVTSRRLDLSVHAPAAVLLHGPEVEVETRDLAWDLALRAGRTDPAPVRARGARGPGVHRCGRGRRDRRPRPRLPAGPGGVRPGRPRAPST